MFIFSFLQYVLFNVIYKATGMHSRGMRLNRCLGLDDDAYKTYKSQKPFLVNESHKPERKLSRLTACRYIKRLSSYGR